MDIETAERITSLEQRSKSNTHRLDALEELAQAINSQGQSIAVMVKELQHTNTHLDTLNARVGQLENRPGALWDKLIGAAIGAIGTGIVGAVLALIIK